MPNAEFIITPAKINGIVSSYNMRGISLTRDNVEKIHGEFVKLTTSIKGQYLAHITRVMENYFREMTRNPLFIIKYTPYSRGEKTGCGSAFHPGRRFVIFYPPAMPERELRVQLAHELGHLFLLASLESKKPDKRIPVYEGATEPLSSIFWDFYHIG